MQSISTQQSSRSIYMEIPLQYMKAFLSQYTFQKNKKAIWRMPCLLLASGCKVGDMKLGRCEGNFAIQERLA